VMFVDEANKLGRFNELKTALGLLPGLGVSIWTFWQSLAQIESNYGKSGAAEFIATAEVTTISNLAKLGDDAEIVSKALGSYSALMPSTSEQTSKGTSSSSKSESARAVRLMTPEQLTSMGEALLVLLNSKTYTPHPMKLDKIKYFDDVRFEGLHDGVKPVGGL
jgi:type IV secretion system protein VirD4